MASKSPSPRRSNSRRRSNSPRRSSGNKGDHRSYQRSIKLSPIRTESGANLRTATWTQMNLRPHNHYRHQGNNNYRQFGNNNNYQHRNRWQTNNYRGRGGYNRPYNNHNNYHHSNYNRGNSYRYNESHHHRRRRTRSRDTRSRSRSRSNSSSRSRGRSSSRSNSRSSSGSKSRSRSHSGPPAKVKAASSALEALANFGGSSASSNDDEPVVSAAAAVSDNSHTARTKMIHQIMVENAAMRKIEVQAIANVERRKKSLSVLIKKRDSELAKSDSGSSEDEEPVQKIKKQTINFKELSTKPSQLFPSASYGNDVMEPEAEIKPGKRLHSPSPSENGSVTELPERNQKKRPREEEVTTKITASSHIALPAGSFIDGNGLQVTCEDGKQMNLVSVTVPGADGKMMQLLQLQNAATEEKHFAQPEPIVDVKETESLPQSDVVKLSTTPVDSIKNSQSEKDITEKQRRRKEMLKNQPWSNTASTSNNQEEGRIAGLDRTGGRIVRNLTLIDKKVREASEATDNSAVPMELSDAEDDYYRAGDPGQKPDDKLEKTLKQKKLSKKIETFEDNSSSSDDVNKSSGSAKKFSPALRALGELIGHDGKDEKKKKKKKKSKKNKRATSKEKKKKKKKQSKKSLDNEDDSDQEEYKRLNASRSEEDALNRLVPSNLSMSHIRGIVARRELEGLQSVFSHIAFQKPLPKRKKEKTEEEKFVSLLFTTEADDEEEEEEEPSVLDIYDKTVKFIVSLAAPRKVTHRTDVSITSRLEKLNLVVKKPKLKHLKQKVSMSLSGLSKSKRLKLEKSAREKSPALELEAVDDRMSQDEEMFYCDHPQTERTPTKDDVEDRSAPTRRAYRERARSSSSSGKSSSVPAQTDRRGRSRRSLPKSYQAYEKNEEGETIYKDEPREEKRYRNESYSRSRSRERTSSRGYQQRPNYHHNNAYQHHPQQQQQGNNRTFYNQRYHRGGGYRGNNWNNNRGNYRGRFNNRGNYYNGGGGRGGYNNRGGYYNNNRGYYNNYNNYYNRSQNEWREGDRDGDRERRDRDGDRDGDREGDRERRDRDGDRDGDRERRDSNASPEHQRRGRERNRDKRSRSYSRGSSASRSDNTERRVKSKYIDEKPIEATVVASSSPPAVAMVTATSSPDNSQSSATREGNTEKMKKLNEPWKHDLYEDEV